MCCLLVIYMKSQVFGFGTVSTLGQNGSVPCQDFHDVSCYIFILPFTIFNNGDENAVPLAFY